MSSDNIAKILFYFSLSVLVLFGSYLFGAYSFSRDVPPAPQLRSAYLALTDQAKQPRRDHMQPSRNQGRGVTINNAPDDDSLVMLTGFFEDENQIRLIRRDGTVFRKWSLDYFDHFPVRDRRICDVISPLWVDVHGAHISPRGEVIFNYEYCGSVKIDQCGGLVWSISRETHHSVVPAESGGYWILGRVGWWANEQPDRFPPFSTPGTADIMREDTVMRVSESGEILDEFSIPVLMQDNGLGPVLTASGEDFKPGIIARRELVHANKATELPAALADTFPLFEAGDLAISMRKLNLVVVIDPVTRKLKWHRIGPWLRQHDPEFRSDGRLSIFNNNAYRSALIDNQTDLTRPRSTNIIAVDPVSEEIEVVYGERPGQEMLTVIRGQHELLQDDGMLIVEFEAGRVFEVDADGEIVWEYVNAYDADFVGEITNAAVLPAGYFEAELRPCNP